MVWIIVKKTMEISLRYDNDHCLYCKENHFYVGRDVHFFSQIILVNVIVKIQNELVIIRVSEAMMSIHMRW